MDVPLPTEAPTDWPVRGVRRLIALGLVTGVLLGLVLEPPASWLQSLARAGSQGLVELDAPAGGFGSGSAGILFHRPGETPRPLGHWRWQFTWTGGGPGWRLDGRDGPLTGSVVVHPGFGILTLADVDLSLPAEAVPPGQATWDLLHAAGTVRVIAPLFRLGNAGLEGQGTVALLQASSTLVALPTLGSWHADWELHEGKGVVTLKTDAGPLHLEGQGPLLIPGRSALHGRAWTEPGSAQVLEPILRLLGRQGPDGSIPLEFP